MMRWVQRVAIALLMATLGSCGPGSDEDAGSSRDADATRDGAGSDGSDTSGPCEPSGAEVCNGVDDDCNGVADDGFVLRCAPTDDGRVEAELTGDGFAEGVVRNLLRGDDRGLALPPLPDRSEHIWVAASADNPVTKIRVADGVEVGRFIVGDNPSRTAVDGNGDAWVAMRGSLGDTGEDGEGLENVVKIDSSCMPVLAPPMATRECVLLDIPDVGNLLRGWRSTRAETCGSEPTRAQR